MAASGATPIQLYRSATASAVPTAGNLADGELAINTNDGRLFYKDSGGVVQTIGYRIVPVTNGGTGVTTSTGTGSVVLSASPTLSGTPTVSGTAAIGVPVGTTGERPTAATGLIRFNSTLGGFEGYNGSVWGTIGGGATGGGTDQTFYLNGQTVNNSYSIPAGQNAGTFGPITVASGAVVTVPSGSTWTVT
jgi:hypothetical protein